MTTINVPERNRAVKRLLRVAFPYINIRVMVGKGTAYHWVHVKFGRRPDPMPITDDRDDINGNRFTDYIATLIRSADIYLSEFPRDDAGRDFGMLPCLTVDLPREVK